VDDVDEVLDPLARRAMIPAATNLVIVAKDQGGAAMLELQRVESVAKETLASLEAEFATAEDALESLRDDLRILQANRLHRQDFPWGSFLLLRPQGFAPVLNPPQPVQATFSWAGFLCRGTWSQHHTFTIKKREQRSWSSSKVQARIF
jgi:hypothetical protein